MNTRSTGMSRRTALQLLASGVAGSALLPQLGAAADGAPKPTAVPRIGQIGLQLYTVRAAMAKDLSGTLAAVAAAGITELEFAGYYNQPAAWWRDTMRAHNMTSPSSHIALPKSDAEWAPHFAMSTAMGQRWVIVPFVGNEFRTPDGYKRLADRLNSGGKMAKAAGLRMGYHNHDFEFQTLEGGSHGLAILLANTDPSLVDFELDLYWAVKAGQDPLALIDTHKNRFACCHVKDAGPAPERAMMDVGSGTIDFKKILQAGQKHGLKHWYIEHDAPTDPLASIAASAAAMKRM